MNQPAGMIFKKMIEIMNDIEAIGKNKTNTQQGYKFRGIDDMYNAIHPLFKKHGVFVLSEVLAEKRDERATKSGGVLFAVVLDVRFSFVAEDGSQVQSTVKGEAMDSGDKATNKALSTALKYALMQTFLIPTEELKELNTENDTPEPVTKKPEPVIKKPELPIGEIAAANGKIDSIFDAATLAGVRNWLNGFTWTKEDRATIKTKLTAKEKELTNKINKGAA
jgi:hypothetical protein